MKPSTAAIFLSPVIFGLSGCDPKPAPPAPADGRRNLLPPPGATSIAALSQGWTEAQAADFYTRPQGSRMIPYEIFRNIEQAGSEELFRTPENFQRLGYLARSADAQNPDALAVGFVKDGDHVGMTCAACHTSVLTHNKKALVIDGGGTLADAQSMITELSAALQATLTDAAKFERFHKRAGAGKSADELRKTLQAAGTKMSSYVARNFPKQGQPAAGHGRLDAFDAIFNEVAVTFAANPQAEVRSDAPVSYPFLWDTPQHDRVQWNGSATNTELPAAVPGLGTRKVGALGRNVGEVLGVFADVDTSRDPKLRGYPNSVNIPNLIQLEETLSQLWSPEWPEAEFGKIDADRKSAGAALYAQHCIECHPLIGDRTNPARKVVAQMSNVDTDLTMARNAAERKSASGVFQGREIVSLEPVPKLVKLEAVEPVGVLLQHTGQRVLEAQIVSQLESQAEQALHSIATALEFRLAAVAEDAAGLKLEVPMTLQEFQNPKGSALLDNLRGKLPSGQELVADTESSLSHLKTLVQDDSKTLLTKIESKTAPDEVLNYKARPLNGIWATAPYLHNGSVRTLDQLLKPAAKREPTFKTGTTEFDPVNVGLKDEGPFLFDTNAQPGNSNAGHDDYGTRPFNDEERAALVEYLKSL